LINEIKPAGEVVKEIIDEFNTAKELLKDIDF
jgi:hypothetical protein